MTKEEALAQGLKRYQSDVPCKHGHLGERYAISGQCCVCAKVQNKAYLATRMAADPDYKARRIAKSAEWLKSHPEKGQEYERRQVAKGPKRAAQRKAAGDRWRLKNPETHRQRSREWASRNKTAKATKDAEWRANNREHMREYGRLRRAKDPQKARDAIKAWEQRNPERAHAIRRVSKINRRAREKAVRGIVTRADFELLFAEQDGCCAGCGKRKKLEVDHVIAVSKGGRNVASNLQLLCRTCNASKGDSDFAEWLHRTFPISALRLEQIPNSKVDLQF